MNNSKSRLVDSKNLIYFFSDLTPIALAATLKTPVFCIWQSIDDLGAFSWILTNVSEINLLHCINFLAADDEISLAKAISTRNPEFLPELPSPAVLASIIIISFCGAISYQRFAAATPV